ncbi:MmyB family transcriptional regulator [Nocardia goodfellowii]
MSGMDALQTGSSPSVITDDDLDHLEGFNGPAYYFSFPQMDVLAANGVARQWVPSLVPADPSLPRPVNMVEWIMSPHARELITNWEAVAARVVYLLRVMGPGLVSQQRLDEIFNTCYAQSPKDFTRAFCTEPSKADMNNDVVIIRNPATGLVEQFTYRFLRPVQPIRPYEQLQIIKRRNR